MRHSPRAKKWMETGLHICVSAFRTRKSFSFTSESAEFFFHPAFVPVDTISLNGCVFSFPLPSFSLSLSQYCHSLSSVPLLPCPLIVCFSNLLLLHSNFTDPLLNLQSNLHQRPQMSFDWPVLRPIRFLAKSRLGNTHTANASLYISSRGFTLQPATAGNRLPRSHYGPGTIFQGELNLHLLKAIPSPCQLRIVLTCRQTIAPMADGPNVSSVTSSKSTTLFTVEHILLNNEALAAKRHFFHFSIKFPMCNYAPSYKVKTSSTISLN